MDRLRMLRAIVCMMLWVVTVNSPGQTQSVNLQELGKQLGIDGKTGKVIDKSLKALKSRAPLGYKEEKAIGGSLAIEAFQRFGGPYHNPTLQTYVTLVARPNSSAHIIGD